MHSWLSVVGAGKPRLMYDTALRWAMDHKWYGDHSVQTALWALARNHETKFQISHREGEVFGIRRRRMWGSDAVKTELKILSADERPIGIFISTNAINWKVIPPDLRPPTLRKKGTSGYDTEGLDEYKKVWDALLLPEPLQGVEMSFMEIWGEGKIMVFDFDDEDDPMNAFVAARQTHEYLLDTYDVPSVIVFSGNKGFHVWVQPEDAESLAGASLKDLVEQKDPLKEQGKRYAKFVKDTVVMATGHNLPGYDLSPNYRQGIVRCPYSIHEKSGQIVWPLSPTEVKNLQKFEKDKLGPREIGEILHAWDTQNFVGAEGLSYFPPCSSIHSRNMWRL